NASVVAKAAVHTATQRGKPCARPCTEPCVVEESLSALGSGFYLLTEDSLFHAGNLQERLSDRRGAMACLKKQ
ncbi:MAG: hypothetical protein WCS31_03965, partial [Verrucomicrobiae bacterium]